MRYGTRFALIACALAGLAGSALASYHFTHYTSRISPYNAIPERFDLAALPNQTVYYYVSDVGPVSLAEGDSFTALLSHIRFAGAAWSGVGTSNLRVAFGGLFSKDTVQATPHMEVVFDEIPEGVLALGSVTAATNTVNGNSTFVPVAYSTVTLNKAMDQPSYGAMAMTIVHEMGHALGLQHTLTSSTMSARVTRATTLAHPLAADDVAAISLLYPNAQFGKQTGTVEGRVTLGGNGVHMASVVVLSPTGEAVSALTDPDGAYRIQGVPPGQCYVYAHTLPPSAQPELGPAEIVLPRDPDGNPVPAGASFKTQFYPGTSDWNTASTVSVEAGGAVTGIDFAVEPSGAPALYGVSTYSFVPTFSTPAYQTVQPAFLNTTLAKRYWYLVAQADGDGLMPGGKPAPGLAVSVLGGVVSLRTDYPYYAYSGDPTRFFQTNFLFTPFMSGSGIAPRHLVYTSNRETYVLPAGLNLADRQPPAITSVEQKVSGDGQPVAILTGSNLTADTRIYFDGLPAAILSYDGAHGTMQVAPPQGASGYNASVMAIDPYNGQIATFIQGTLPVFSYGATETAAVTLSTNSLPAGTESIVEVTGANTNFRSGETTLGFGSADIVVKKLWVLSPTSLRANVQVAAGATPGSSLVSVTTGFQTISMPFAFQTTAANAGMIALSSDVVNATTGEALIYPGATVKASVRNAGGNPLVTLDGTAVPVLTSTEGEITFQIPPTYQPGVVALRVQNGNDMSAPVAITIDLAPPVITSVLGPGGTATQEVYIGDQITILVAGLEAAGTTVDPSRVHVTIGGVDLQPFSPVLPLQEAPGVHAIPITLLPTVAAGKQGVTVSIANRKSAAYAMTLK